MQIVPHAHRIHLNRLKLLSPLPTLRSPCVCVNRNFKTLCSSVTNIASVQELVIWLNTHCSNLFFVDKCENSFICPQLYISNALHFKIINLKTLGPNEHLRSGFVVTGGPLAKSDVFLSLVI